MGRRIAFYLARHGFSVTLHDTSRKALIAAQHDGEHVSPETMDIAFCDDDAEAVYECDLLVESIPEDMALKCALFTRLNSLCDERTIFTSNTSTFLPSMLAPATGRADRFCALHFLGTIHDIPWVEIAPHGATAPSVVASVEAFADQCDLHRVTLQKENVGHIFNALYGGLNGAALNLAVQGVAAIPDIDALWKAATKMDLGPFEIMDTIGIDVVHQINKYWGAVLNNGPMLAAADFLQPYIDNKTLGKKSGRGFYSWPAVKTDSAPVATTR